MLKNTDKKYTYEYFSKRNACRLCWKTTNGTITIKNDFMLSQFITKHIGLSVKGHILKTVCSSCANTIRHFISFRKVCLETDIKLQKILANSSLEKKRKFEDHYRDPKVLRKEADLELKLVQIAINREDFQVSINTGTNQKQDALDAARLKINVKSEDNYHSSREAHVMLNTLRYKVKVENSNKPKSKPTSKELSKSSTSYLARNYYNKPMTKSDIKTENPVVKCETCSETFINEYEYKVHKNKKHPNKKVCEICGKAMTKSSYSRHKRVHNNVRVPCKLCDKTFRYGESLNIHIRAVHMRERRFACHVCPIRCTTRRALKLHLNTHAGVRDYKCHLCPNCYSTKLSLDRHIAIFHEGKVKQHVCPHCSLRYNTTSQLRRHMFKKHGIKIKIRKDRYFVEDDGNNQICDDETMKV